MSKRVIIPEGDELLYYLNNGYAICNDCGAVMDREERPELEYDVYVCPSCGYEVDTMDYEYEKDEEWTSEMLGMYGGDVPPAGCRECGGPYPDCEISCRLYDE